MTVAAWLKRAFARPLDWPEAPDREFAQRSSARVESDRPVGLAEDIFRSGAYLEEYYSSLGHENAEVGEFLLETATQLLPRGRLKVLDAGCGPTILYWSVFLPGESEVHGFDVNPVSISENKRRMAELQCGVADHGLLEAAEHAITCMGARTSARFHLADRARQVASLKMADMTATWPYESAQFDLVLSCFVLEQLPDWETFDFALREASRVLRPGGRFALVNGSQGTHWLCDKQRFPTLFVVPDDLRSRIARAGLRVRAMREIDSNDTDWRDQGYSKVLLTSAEK